MWYLESEGRMNITNETRRASYRQLKPQMRWGKILMTLKGNQMTAREIATKLGFTDMNYVRPRISELQKYGVIQACGATVDPITHKTVAIFEIVEGAIKDVK